MPSALEWNELIVYLGADSLKVATEKSGYKGVAASVGNKLKADREWSFPSGRQFANESGFGALPAGYVTKDAGNNLTSRNLGGDAQFWTASFYDSTRTELQIRTLKNNVSGSNELGIRTGRLAVDDKWYTACRCVEN